MVTPLPVAQYRYNLCKMFECADLIFTVGGSVQTSKQAYTHGMGNTVMLVWGLLRVTPSKCLSSCFCLQLMHQIDVLISSKQKDWESKLQVLRTQLQHRERDLSSLRVTVQEREAQVPTASN